MTDIDVSSRSTLEAGYSKEEMNYYGLKSHSFRTHS